MGDRGLQVKVDQFNAFTRDLARRTGASIPDVIEAEVAKILEAAAKKTKRATAASIRKSQQSRSAWRTYSGEKIRIDWKMPNEKWAKVQSRQKESLQKRKQAAGLASTAWMEMAKRLGKDVNFPAATKKAKQPPGFPSLTSIQKGTQPDRFFVTIRHNSQVLFFANGRQALFAAVQGRIRFYEMNLKRGVFNSATETAKKYRGIRVTRT